MRHVLAAAALALFFAGGMLTRELRWEGLLALFVGGCLWWTSLHLSRSAWQAAQARRHGSPRK
jgi:hypothetical protein